MALFSHNTNCGSLFLCITELFYVMFPVGREYKCQLLSAALRQPTDEMLGFEAAVAALGLKANVSEADHPLLCEGTRRQR